MSLPFFRGGAAARPPVPHRLWSVKLGRPLLAIPLAPFDCLWVHFVAEERRTYIHDPKACRYCLAGRHAQRRGYAPALIMSAEGRVAGKPAPEPAAWVRGVLELPEDAMLAIEPGWPTAWLLERLDRPNGRVRVSRKAPKVAIPEVTELWPIEPTVSRVYGLASVIPGGVN